MILYDGLEVHKADYARVMAAAANPSLEFEFVTTLLTTGSVGRAEKAVVDAMTALKKATGRMPSTSPRLDRMMGAARAGSEPK